MKLAAKLILIFMLGVLAIVTLFSWQTVRRQRAWLTTQREQHATNLVEALRPAIIQAYRDGGSVQIQQVVEVTQQYVNGPQMRWVDPSMPSESFDNPESPAPRTQITSTQRSRILISDKDGRAVAYTYVPLSVDGQDTGAIEVSEPLSVHEGSIRDSYLASLISLLGVAGLSAAVILFGGILLVGRPLNKLIHQVEQIGLGEMPQPPVVKNNDELGRLASAISQMSHRLGEQRQTIRSEVESHFQTQQQLRHADRLGTVGTLAAGVAHELGTPLNVVAGRASLIAGGKLTSDEIAASARTIKFEAERMTAIIRQLLDFARHKSTLSGRVDLKDVVERTCDLMKPLAANAKVELVFEQSGVIATINGDASQIQQIMANLASNAIQAMPAGGRATFTMEAADVTPPIGVPEAHHGYVCVQLKDTGIGMTEDELNHVFEPFFTTKDTGQGTGLGLSIAYGIVRDHGGWIETESAKGQGTTFRVFLPMII